MFLLFYKKYSLSKFATFVSVVGMLIRWCGLSLLFSGLVLEGLITFAVGAGIHFCAEAISKNKTKKMINEGNKPTAPSAPAKQPSPSPVVKRPAPTSVANMLKCERCEATNDASAKFCSHCGLSLTATTYTTRKVKKCLRCGTPVEDGNKFCSNCGLEIKSL